MGSYVFTRRSVVVGLAALPMVAHGKPALFSQAFDTARNIKQLHALVIAQNGQIIKAQAFRGPALGTPVNVKSVSKSLISALTGIAIQRGELDGTATLVAPLLHRAVPRRADPRMRQITVGHMLSMQSGLQEVSGAAYGQWVGTKHWIYEALGKPMVADPGTAMLYSTASYHVLGAVLTRVADTDLHELAQSRIGAPPGIDIPPWTRDPQGRYVGGNDMLLSPLAMVRFGEMYRLGGAWQNTRILTSDWITRSWTPYGNSRETGHGYGYGWFIWRAAGHDIFYARGYGGQMIYVVPDRALTVVMTSNSGLPATPVGHLGALNRLLTEKILPAAQS